MCVRRDDKMLSASILLSFVIQGLTQTSFSPVRMADTEPYEPYTEPVVERRWVSYIREAENLGLLFAGKAEFTWVVDVRIHNTDQEFWSIGNLFSAQWVLTTCRTKLYLDQAWNSLSSEYVPTAISSQPEGAIVTFFQLYYWEYVEHTNPSNVEGSWDYGGSRRIAGYHTHPNCNTNELMYDVAMIKLRGSINPASPFIGYMPAIYEQGNWKFPDVDFTATTTGAKMCFVGSIGRNYVNWRYHLVQDFKVRYRVYIEVMSQCTSLVKRLCDSSGSVNCEGAFSGYNNEGREWSCMRTRAKVGTVCDHDRGAPVVCDDVVVGMVVYGALYKNCNDLIPMPFLVIKYGKYANWVKDTTS